MTRDEAIDYIRSHPDQFKGFSEDEVMSRVQSSDDPNYYNPTLFVPEQKKTIAKSSTPTRGATVGPSKPITQASKPTVIKPVAANGKSTLPVQSALIGKLKGVNAFPWILGLSVIGLGAGMAIYKATR